MNSFIIGQMDFGIDIEDIQCEIDHTDKVIRSLRIKGDKKAYDENAGSDNSPWNNTTLYPPELYLEDVPYETIQSDTLSVNINEDVLNEYDVALYFMEHNDIKGQLTINTAGQFQFEGNTTIGEKDFACKITCMLPL